MESIERTRDRPSSNGSSEIGRTRGEVSPSDSRLEAPHLRLEFGESPGTVAVPSRKEDLLSRHR